VRADETVGLPRVVTVYSPADPAPVLDRHRPRWIAVDCGDDPSIRWLYPLLEHTQQQGIQVVAWGQNPLSESLALFREYGELFLWPATVPEQRALTGDGVNGVPLRRDLKTIFTDDVVETTVQPYVLEGSSVDRLDESLNQARRLLLRTIRRRDSSGRLATDTLRAHWRCLSALSTLCVPLDLHESEAQHTWGLQPVSRLLRSCEVFREACRSHLPDLAGELDRVGTLLETALATLQSADPPLWDALCQQCLEELGSSEARLITFSSRARKQLFLLALLARYNIVQEELEELSVWVASLDDLHRWTRQLSNPAEGNSDGALDAPAPDLSWHPLLVGLPSAQTTAKLAPFFAHKHADVLVYPHQQGALAQRMAQWQQLLNPNATTALKTLRSLGCPCDPGGTLPTGTRIRSEVPATFNVRKGRIVGRASAARTASLWEPDEDLESVARLLRAAEDADEEESAPLEERPAEEGDQQAAGSTGEPSQEAWCAEALRVGFSGNWSVLYDPAEQVNVVVATASEVRLDRRYVRSLRRADRVLLIHGQRRQNLYDLVISRVHRNSAVELHVALVRRWQDDFAVAYRRWKKHGERNLNELLAQMRVRGSELTSAFTLRQWLLRNTLCPHDKEDLRRLAEVLGMSFVKEHYRRIHDAASYLRGLHRGLSNRLNRWLEQEAFGAEGRSNYDDVIDERLGLKFSDFRSSLQVLAVEQIEVVEGPFLRTTLGRVERSN
jgi:hypothetical protein